MQGQRLFQLRPGGEGFLKKKTTSAKGLTEEEGSLLVPSLWPGMKGSLTKPLMSPITFWYLPPRLPTFTLPPPPARSQDLPLRREPGWLANLGPVPASRSFGFGL